MTFAIGLPSMSPECGAGGGVRARLERHLVDGHGVEAGAGGERHELVAIVEAERRQVETADPPGRSGGHLVGDALERVLVETGPSAVDESPAGYQHARASRSAARCRGRT